MYDEGAKRAVKGNQTLFESILESRRIDRQGRKWRCPFHDDQHPSASLFTGQDGAVRFSCRVCDLTLDVFGFVARFDRKPIGDAMRELMPNNSTSRPAGPTTKRPERVFPSLDALIQATPHFVEKYEYQTADGTLRMVTLRCEPPGERKQFVFAHPVRDGFAKTAPAKPWVLYRLPGLADAGTVVVAEGERKADVLAEYGLAGTSAAGGAGMPPGNSDWRPLAAKNVVLWPDAGETGRAFMRDVAAHLEKLNPAPRISTIDPSILGLTGKEEGQPPRDDVVDLVRMLKESGLAEADILVKLLDALDTAKTKSVLAGLIERHRQIVAGAYRAIDFPFAGLSDATRALLPGRIALLAGTVGASKSFLAMQCVLYWLAQGENVSLYALERTKEDHLCRALAQLAGKSGHTRPDWIAAHAEEAEEDRETYRAELERFAYHLNTTDSLGAETLDQIAGWIEEEAKAGRRIVCVDPVTAATRVGKPWEADQRFLQAVDKTVKAHGCSVFLISHPEKGTEEPTRANLAGGACYERFCSAVLTLHNHPDRSDTIKRGPGTVEDTYNRTLRVEKAGDSWGTCLKLAYRFSGESLTMSELGPIVRKKGQS